MGTNWLAQERAAASLRAYNDAIAKERLAGAWSKLYDERERLWDLLLRVRDELHHKHGPDDGDTCYACFLEGEIDKAAPEQFDGSPCRHSEHAIRASGRVGRWFPEPYDGVGTWEPCDQSDGSGRDHGS